MAVTIPGSPLTMATLQGLLNGALAPITVSGGVVSFKYNSQSSITLNAAALPSAQTDTVLQFGNANSVITRVEADAFAAAAHFSGLRSEGTAASPTAVAAGSEIVRLGAGGYNGTAWIVGAGGLRVFANPSGSTWTTGDNGTYADIAVTAPGATSLTQVAKFSSSSIVFPAGGVMIGLNTPTAPLTITTQTGTLPTPSIGGTIIHAIGADGSNSGVELDAFQNGGSNVQGIVGFRGANGTLASPSALTAANGSIGAFNWFGYNGSAYVQGGRIRGLTSENWGASNGFHFDFGTVAAGSTSVATAMSIYGGVVIGSGTTDPGAGNLSVGGNVTVNGNGIASTSTDAVILANGTAATSGAQAQWSPRVHLQGQGWASTPAASQTVDLISELQIAGGTTAPTGALVWSAQTAGGGYTQLASLSTAGQLTIGSANTTVWGAGFGNLTEYGGAPAIITFRANGSVSSPTALNNGDVMAQYGFRGYNGSGFATVSSAFLKVIANGAWVAGSNQGAYYQFGTTPNGSVASASQAMAVMSGIIIGSGNTDPGAGNLTVSGAMQVGAPTGGVPATGSINVAGGIYLNNSAYTNPDFVFEKHFTGQIVKFAERPRAKEYRGLMALDDLATHIRETLRLPGIGDLPTDIFERGDIALEKIEELILYTIQLHARVADLERAA